MNDADRTPDELRADVAALRSRVAELESAVSRLEHDQMLLDALMNHLPDHIYFKDRESRFIRVNPAMAAKHGCPASDLIGKTDFDLFTKEHAQPAFEGEQAIIKTGEAVVGLIEKETWQDGHTSWVTTTKLPLTNAAGEIIGTFGVSRDITELKRAEDAVADSEQLYHSLVDSLSQNVFRKDLWGRVTFANATYCQTLGRPLPELLGQTDFDLFPKELAEKYVADDQKVIDTRQPLELIEEHRKPSGELMYVQVVKTPIVDSAGRVTGTQGMFWDVTEKKLYEETLERLAAIVESSEDAIIGASIDGTILSWNPGAERLYGYAAPEIIGKKIEVLVPSRLQDEVLAVKERMVADERISNLETVRITKDGREIKVSVSVAPIKNGGGRIVGISGITRDISARTQAEQAIDELAAIMRSSPDAIIGHTLEGTVTTWNPAAEKLYGYSGDEMLGKSITLLSPPDRQDELFSLVGRVAREERIDAYPTVHVTRDGRHLDVTLTVSPVVDTEMDRVTAISIIAREAGKSAPTTASD